MAENPPPKDAPASVPKPAAANTSAPAGNPALRALGIPAFSRWKLPSRNWLIFLSITGSWTAALLYDRYHKKRAQKKWCDFVAHLADEPLSNSTMPRKITIVLAAPPMDGLRPAREHFHEYIKPILVAGAIDWEVIEGRRQGEVRAGLAEKIRKLRRRNGEKATNENDTEEEQDLVRDAREKLGVLDWDGIQGDLILGRHTWKEYIRGLHEGWLGPLDAPPPPDLPQDPPLDAAETISNPDQPNDSSASSTSETDLPPSSPQPDKPPETPPETPSKPPPTPSYLPTTAYPTSPLAPSLPSTLPPSLPVHLPHLLGIKHTPTRIYGFLTRRHLADDTGARVAALVLATRSRPYESSATEFASAVDPDTSPSNPNPNPNTDSSSDGKDVVELREIAEWEQQHTLENEEAGWSSRIWKDAAAAQDPASDSKEKGKEWVWTDKMIVDPRIAGRMRTFELEEGARERAEVEAEEKRGREPGVVERVRGWVGLGVREKRGWEMGEVGGEDD